MLALALGGFGIGTTEFVSMGLLPLIAQDFGISEDQAGHVISAYALGVVIGAPLISATTGRVPRRRLLLILMVAFILGHLIATFAAGYGTLMAARFLAGLPHGAYFSVAGLAAASMSPPGKRGQAVAYVGLGLAVATVAGVPAAQALGHALGWQSAYALVATIGLATLVSLWFVMPHMSEMKPTSMRTELGALKRTQVWLTLALGTIGFGGMFAVYTYVAWTMTERAGLPPALMWIPLMAYGGGMVVGNFVGGWLADRNLDLGILFSLSMIAIALVCYYFTSQFVVLGIINFGVIGFFGSTLVPSLQVRLMDVAGDAQMLAASLNHSALNLANASGAALGGAVIAAGYSYSAPALAGACLAVIAIVIWVPTTRLRQRLG
ncbi:MFS transporter [Corynebacterium tapiri]|uniref:MFS transporter n=1 Tax=Corynebacterium tapiri TaxID=1448266 RepID=A0A5C4U5R5_9CORY|nr:MFS transporter [Corynebacterium tapiri]TNL98600.1 MFS transporter [Corynebacterium tapiri]